MPDGFASPNPSPLSLADFFMGESSDPLTPPAGFSGWRKEVAWATALYEPVLLAAPGPRTRIRVAGREHSVINLASYDYLGLARHPAVTAAAQEALERYGTGACGSPILSGITELHGELERRISAYLQREATMLFSSGFGGAQGCLSGLLRRGDAVFADACSHFSLLDGARLSRARLEMFAHNDPEALDAALARSTEERRLVVVEGIYSMEGDAADLRALCAVAERHGAAIVVDEAHSVLVCGAHGRGVSEAQDVEARVGLYFGTLSKAFGGVGGFVSGRAETIDYLRNYAHPYAFSCALPPATVAGLLAALEIATRSDGLRQRVGENARYFREQLASLGIDTGTATAHVVPIIIDGGSPELYRIGHELLARGLFVPPIDYPAVPQDRLRFRASITVEHTRADLDEALTILQDVMARDHAHP